MREPQAICAADYCQIKVGYRALFGVLGTVLLWVVGAAHAQTPVAVDDAYDAPAGRTLVVEDRGVLENDTDTSGEDLPPTAMADLTADVSSGALTLDPDGSFTYAPVDGFSGVVTFRYRVIDGALTSNEASVTLAVSGCAGTLPLLTCWIESDYVARIHELGHGTFQEGFEDDAAWGPVRSPNTAPSVTSNAIVWSPNNATSRITTGTGPVRTGLWGVFSLPHGEPTGGAFDPLRDGFTGTAGGILVGIGGWLTSNTGGARVQFILSSPPATPLAVDFDASHVVSQHRFFGVIDTRGFSTFEIVETEGVVEDQEFIFADDFTIGTFDTLLSLPLDVDENGRVDVATDLVYTVRHLLDLPAVPQSFRDLDATIPPDDDIATLIDLLGDSLDVDGNSVADAATDIVYVARHLLGLPPVPQSFRDLDPSIPPDAEIIQQIEPLLRPVFAGD